MPTRTTSAPTRLVARSLLVLLLATATGVAAACRDKTPENRVRVSGHVEADDVQIAPEVGGRVLELKVAEGDRVNQGDLVSRLDTRDTELALGRTRAERPPKPTLRTRRPISIATTRSSVRMPARARRATTRSCDATWRRRRCVRRRSTPAPVRKLPRA